MNISLGNLGELTGGSDDGDGGSNISDVVSGRKPLLVTHAVATPWGLIGGITVAAVTYLLVSQAVSS